MIQEAIHIGGSAGHVTQELAPIFMQAAGLSAQVVEPVASELLSAASGGLPRSPNLLARAAWIQAATQGAQKISAARVQNALESVAWVPGLNTSPPLPSGLEAEPATLNPPCPSPWMAGRSSRRTKFIAN